MSELVGLLQNAAAVAFALLGLATAASWIRHRDSSLGFLALAIVLLSLVSLMGRVPALLHFTPPLLGQLSLAGFMGSGYALLRYRASLIPLPRRWHAAALVAMVAAGGFYLSSQALGSARTVTTAAGLVLVLIWSASVGEPIVRFWLVARRLPAVQAWRLRSLSLGFGGLVAVLLFAVLAGELVTQPVVQVLIELVVLGIVPLLYVSFAPPAWLRREWRAAEEDGLRAFMEELLVKEDLAALVERAVEWAMRLVGGESAAVFDRTGRIAASRALTEAELDELKLHFPHLEQGVRRERIAAADRTLLVLPAAGLTGSWTVVILSGPFTPEFGGDEVRRVHQFASAFVTAIDRRQLLVQLEETNAMLKEASRHKSQFMANMSHELRTPLNAIIGFSELLTDAADGQIDEATRKRFTSQILNGGRHLLALINDILDLSKVEAGQMELRLETVVVAEIVEQVTRTVEPLVGKKGIRLEADASAAGELRADPGKLKQMLLNLVSNAIKFTPEGGRVAISAIRKPGAVEISVADSGIGIAEADQTQIFQEFHQVDPGPGRRHEGTGLGLALTKRFAVLHGGDVRMQSRVNEGSIFTLTLPLEKAAQRPAAQPAAVAANGNGAGPMVLVVEDDPAAAELLTRQLANAGYRTQIARTGMEAIARARQLHPAAITLDVILPELDGWEVMSRLKSDRSTSGIPIVVVSVVDNPELGMALGAVDYLVKPVDGKDLVRRLRRFDSRRILVVDDEAANREWLTQTLEPAGFKVVSASGGREAISMARSHPPDLVLLDLMMPEVNGFDVVEALRKNKATRETPIMILTAASLTEGDKRKLNGRVSQILSRGSVGASDLVGLLQQAVVHQNGAK